MAHSLNVLGAVELARQRWPDADAALAEAQSALEQVQLRGGAGPQVDAMHAMVLSNRAEAQREIGQFESALVLARQAVGFWEPLARAPQPGIQALVNYGGSCHTVGTIFAKQGEPDSALRWFNDAVVTLERVLGKVPGEVDAQRYLKATLLDRASALERLDRDSDAEADRKRAATVGNANAAKP